MAATQTEGLTSVVAVFPDHPSAEEAVRRLQKDGIPMQNVSIIGKVFQVIEKPLGFVTTRSVAKDGARFGAWTGGIFGLLVGAAFLIVPGLGAVVIAGPLTAALLGSAEGALAGAALGGLTEALFGLGVSKEKAIRYETQVQAGKFLVTLQGDPAQIERAKALFTAGKAETTEVVQEQAA